MLKNIVRACVAAATIAASILASPAAHAQITVNQGDYVSTTVTLPQITPMLSGQTDTVSCTIGYVDKANNRALYAGHCARGLTGIDVKNASGHTLGTVVSNPYQDHGGYIPGPALMPHTPNDWAVIQLAPGVVAGNNSYSGDQFTTARPGDTLCSYGHTTRRVLCGKVIGAHGQVTVATRNAGGVVGDSGGPAWVPGRGFVGVYSLFSPVYTVFTKAHL